MAIDLARLHRQQQQAGSAAAAGQECRAEASRSDSQQWPTFPQVHLRACCRGSLEVESQQQGLGRELHINMMYSRQRCWVCLAQVDFAPTLAMLLGVPIPYGSIGRVSPQLWRQRGCSGCVAADACDAEYATALHANAKQVIGVELLDAVRTCPISSGLQARALTYAANCALRVLTLHNAPWV